VLGLQVQRLLLEVKSSMARHARKPFFEQDIYIIGQFNTVQRGSLLASATKTLTKLPFYLFFNFKFKNKTKTQTKTQKVSSAAHDILTHNLITHTIPMWSNP